VLNKKQHPAQRSWTTIFHAFDSSAIAMPRLQMRGRLPVQVFVQIRSEQVGGQPKAIEMRQQNAEIIATDRKFTVSREAPRDQPERQADSLEMTS